MTSNRFRKFRKRINDHLYAEARMIEDMLESDLLNEEWEELTAFIKNHPYNEVLEIFRKNREIRESKKT